MGKTYLETIKYLIVADFQVDGLVEKPDVIGAIFGQSEGLLGSQLDIKDLQQNGKIGRIEITTTHNNNKTFGTLKLPCSLSMVETVIIGASIESIDKVGPCDTRFTIKKIEDTRGLKRKQIKDRAIDLLGKLMQEEIPDTKELMEEIVDTFKTKEIVLYGPDKLPAGPTIDSNKELIIVEGRADVITMLRYGFTNVISTGGARVPSSLAGISKDKIVTLFLDGDRGADIQQSQLIRSIKVDYIARAPDGKEVEELTQKEINQALRRRIKSTFVIDVNGKDKIGSENKSQSFSEQNSVKYTKFSTTNDRKFVSSTPGFDGRPSSEGKPSFEKPKYNFPKEERFKDNKPSTDFSSMLSNIPDVERIDVSNDSFSKPSFGGSRNNRGSDNRNGRYSQDKNRSHDRYNNRENKHFNKPNDFNKRAFEPKVEEPLPEVNSFVDPLNNNDNFKAIQTKITLKDRLESALKEFDNKTQVSTKGFPTDSLPPLQSSSPKTTKENVKEGIVKENIKEPEKVKKKIVLPKLTEKMKKSFLEILDEVDGKGQSRILNEKLRRIGSSKSDELTFKIKSFKTGKIFAVVTDLEITSEFLGHAKEKEILFLISPRSKIKEDPEINIVTYNDLKK